MASSNSYNFVLTRDNIIDLAHQHIGVVGEGLSATANQVTEAAKLLNMIIKVRAADGMPLWALKRGTILPTTSTSSVNTNSHIVTAYDTTTLSAAEAALQTVISVTSSTGFTAADQVGIELDSGEIHWTTIVSVDSSVQITITTAIPTAAASGSRVYAYTASTDRIQRPLRILQANVLEVSGGSTWEIEVIPREDYYALGSRTSEGVPSQIYYDATLGTAVADPATSTTWYGTVFIYPRFQDGNNVIEFTYHRPFADLDSASENPDMPQEFYLPLMLELAAMLAPKFQLPLDERRQLMSDAKFYREEALSTIYAEGSLRIIPDYGD